MGDTRFSIDRGFYEDPFDTDITCDTPGATIIYTLDGSEPTLVNGIQVPAASSTNTPIATLNMTNTTILRAAAFLNGFEPSDVDTMSYIFVEDVVNQTQQSALDKGFPTTWNGVSSDYEMDREVIGPGDLFGGIYAATIRDDLLSLPSVSISLPVDDLFGPAGVYANPGASGSAWERACSMEWIYPDGSEDDFQIDCGIRMQGGASRSWTHGRKKSMRFLFKSQYGAGKLERDLFGGDAVDEFDTLTFRMEFNDGYSWGGAGSRPLYTRDQMARDTQRLVGSPSPHGTRVHLYLNGCYWGVYNPVERPDNSFGAAYIGGEKDEWDGLVTGGPVNASGEPGKAARANNSWSTMVDMCSGISTALTEDVRTDIYLQVQGKNPDGTDNPAWEAWVDITNNVHYMLVNFFIGNSDWPHNNWYAGRWNHPDTKGWQFFCWDSEWSMGLNSGTGTDRTGVNNGVATPYGHLRNSAEYRLVFADQVQKTMFKGGPLSIDENNPNFDPQFPERNPPAARFWNLTEIIRPAMSAETARWGDQHRATPYTRDLEWSNERNNIMNNYWPNRWGNVIADFRAAGLYPNTDAPCFNQDGGIYETPFNLVISSAVGTVYYTFDGTDPREFRTSNPIGNLYAGPIPLTTAARVKARVLNGGEWSALTEALFIPDTPSPIRISEVMYHGHDPVGAETNGLTLPNGSDFDYIEIQNTGPSIVSLVGLSFSEGIDFDFEQGAVQTLGPGEHVVVVENLAAFTNRYPNPAIRIAGQYSGTLNNNGETVTLSLANTGTVVRFTYNDGRGWPCTPDGAGHSLVPLVLAGQTNDLLDHGANWRASTFRAGSPGFADPAPIVDLVINEIAAHTDVNMPPYDSDDWIELYNTTAGGFLLDTNWYLSDDFDDLKKWNMPVSTIPGNGWVSYDEITGFHNPITSGFGINKAGEQILLSYLPGTAMDRVADCI
ncbi:MAG: chitobiase/beta-hexosaminidase C-terminal domain-containing protein, partial [Verrucomicrobiota bacterium]